MNARLYCHSCGAAYHDMHARLNRHSHGVLFVCNKLAFVTYTTTGSICLHWKPGIVDTMAELTAHVDLHGD